MLTLEVHFPTELSLTLIKLTCLYLSSNPEDPDYLVQLCLIRAGAKLCRNTQKKMIH